jgi:hypothetical protein
LIPLRKIAGELHVPKIFPMNRQKGGMKRTWGG